MYRDSSDKLVHIKSPDDYATFLHALEKKTVHRTGGRISFTVSLFEDGIQSADDGPDEETIGVPTFQLRKRKRVDPIPAPKEKYTSTASQGPKTRRNYKPSQRAQENADLQQVLQSQSESKRKLKRTVSAKDARAAREFSLDHEE